MTTEPLEIPTYEEAQADVDRLAAQHTEWTERRATLVQSLEAQRANAGRAALTGTPTGELADQITRLQTEIGIADEALAAIVDEQRQAARTVTQARAADSRRRAADLRVQAEARWKKTQELRTALEAWEGIAWAPVAAYAGQMARTDLMVEEAERYERQAAHLESQL